MTRTAAVSLALLLGLSALAAAQSRHAMPDDVSGPTCESYLPLGGFKWRNKGGDWTDALGIAQGPQAYAAALVGDATQPKVVLDVSPLVQSAHARGQRTITLMLRAVAGAPAGQVDFHSREQSDATWRPTLEVTWSDGEQERVVAQADTTLDCTSAYSLGQWPVFSVRNDRSALLNWRWRAKPGGASIKQARLTLTLARVIGPGTRLGVFEARVPYEQDSAPVQRGLAAAHVLDAGIERHPEVFFASRFDEVSWALAWRDATVRSHAEVIDGQAATRLETPTGRALRVRVPRGEHLGLDLRYHFARHGKSEPEQAYLRYYLRLGDDWDPVADGGKLPGLAGTYGKGGWGDRVSNGKNGWSMRAAFSRSMGTSAFKDHTTLGVLACHGRVADVSCETWGWGGGNGAVLRKNRWYAIEQHVRLNTPGKADGVFEAWVDGRLVYRNLAVLYRDVPELRIETAWMNLYHGGSKPAAADMTAYIAAVVIARSYIGPLGGWVPPVDPPAGRP